MLYDSRRLHSGLRRLFLPRRYSALKSLGEKKACFNEYTQQRKKDEVLERRLALKKAREDFNTMLEECAELSTGLRLSKAAQILEDDPRWKVSCLYIRPRVKSQFLSAMPIL